MRCSRFPGLLLLAIIAIGFTATTVLAANPHFVKGPTFTDNGVTLTATGTIAGLGNQDLTLVMTIEATGKTQCVNPGGNTAPGIDRKLKLSVTKNVKAIDIDKNGSYTFTLITPSPTQPTAKEAGCPNGNWRASIIDVVFATATFTVTQGGKTINLGTFPVQ